MECQGPKIKSGDKMRVKVNKCVVHPSKIKGRMDKMKFGCSALFTLCLNENL